MSFATVVLLARLLDERSLGVYSFYIAAYTLALVPATTGLSRFNVISVAGRGEELGGKLLQEQAVGALFLTLLSLLSAVLFYYFYPGSAAVFLFFLFPISAWTSYEMSVMRGRGYVLIGNIDAMLLRPLVLLFSLCGMFLIGFHITEAHAIVAVVLSVIVTRILLVPWIKLPKFTMTQAKSSEVLKSKSLIATLTLVGSIEVLLANIDVLMLGAIASYEDVALYRVAVAFKALAVLPLQSFNLFLPYLLARLAAMKPSDLVTQTRVLVLGNFIFTILISVLFVFYGDILVMHVFGESFIDSNNLLVPIMLGLLISSVFGPSLETLIASGGQGWVARIAIATLALCFVLHFLLITFIGVLGAEVAWSLSYIFLCASCNLVLHRECNLVIGLVPIWPRSLIKKAKL